MSGCALVTGASGFAGRRLVEQLVTSGWQVAGTVRSRSIAVEGVAEHRIAIDDREGLARLVGELEPDVVFHLAALVDTVATPDVVHLYRVNTIGTATLIEALHDAGSAARLLFASSAFVYGVTGPDEQPLSEDRPLRPLTPYGASKVASEAIVAQRDRSGAGESVIARAFQHTGPGHVGAYALADWACQLAEIEAGRRSGPIRCGNLDVERDYLDVRDVAAGYLAAGTAGRAGEIYNIASGAPSSMRFLLESLIEAFGVDVEIEVDAARMRSVDQPCVYGDASKLRHDTGWAPAVEIRRSLADLAAFWRRRVAEEREPAAT